MGAAADRTGWRWRRLTTPVVAPILRDRGLAAVLAATGLAQVTLTLLHVGGLPCPFLAVTGRPCPGCGLSRGCAALCRGQWGTAVRLHAFAPVFAVAVALVAAAAVLPAGPRDAVARVVAAVERRSWASHVLLAAVVLYWVVRLCYAPAEIARVSARGF